MKKKHLAIGVATALAMIHAGAMASDKPHSAHAHAVDAKEQKPWGVAGEPSKVTRTITISMTDNMRFTPDKLEVKQGETVKFVLPNDGAILHEFVLGTKESLDQYALKVLKSPDMEHHGPDMVHVDPAKAGTLVWTFNRPGDFDFACLIPGHYQAGMIGTVRVVTK